MKSTKLKTVTVPLSEKQYDALKKLAASAYRSMGSQIVAMIESALK